VEPVYELWETPSNYRRYPGGDRLPDKLKVWRVQRLTRDEKTRMVAPYGAVAKPWKPSEAPDTEILVAGYNLGKMDGAVAVGRERNFLQWGYSAPPSKMTEAGRAFFLNSVCYIAKFPGKGKS
jgi:hypothetical protein